MNRFPGQWRTVDLPDSLYGELVVDDRGRHKLELRGQLTPKKPLTSLDPWLVRAVQGDLADGRPVTLFQNELIAHEERPNFIQEEYVCRLALYGRHEREPGALSLRSAAVQLDALPYLLGLQPIRTVPTGDGGRTISYVPLGLPGVRLERASMSLGVRSALLTSPVGSMGMTLEPLAAVVMDYDMGVPLERVLGDAEGTQLLLTMVAGYPVNITGIHGTSESTGERGIPVGQAIGWPPNYHTGFRAIGPTAFSGPSLIGALPSIADKYSANLDRLVDPLRLFASVVFSSGMTPELDFLLLVQAVESFHRNIFGGNYFESKPEFKKVYDLLRDTLKAHGLSGDKLESFTTRVSHADEYVLRTRLVELLATLPPRVSNQLLGSEIPPEGFVDGIVKTRNYLTHRDKASSKGALTDFNLTIACQRVATLFWYVFLDHLGLPGLDQVDLARVFFFRRLLQEEWRHKLYSRAPIDSDHNPSGS